MKIVKFLIYSGLFLLFNVGATSERAQVEFLPSTTLDIIVSFDPKINWPAVVDPSFIFLNELLPKLSLSLNRQINLVSFPGGNGVAAATQLVNSTLKKGKQEIALLTLDSTITRVISSRTPYLKDELIPIVLAWRKPLCLVSSAESSFNDLTEMKQYAKKNKVRLLLTENDLDGGSVNFILSEMLAIEGGWHWVKIVKPHLDPTYLLNGEADVIVMSLSDVINHNQANKLKILAVDDPETTICGFEFKTLVQQNFKSHVPNWLGFYLAQGSQGVLDSVKLNHQLLNLLNLPEFVSLKNQHCFTGEPMGYDEAHKWLNIEYQKQLKLMKELDIVEP